MNRADIVYSEYRPQNEKEEFTQALLQLLSSILLNINLNTTIQILGSSGIAVQALAGNTEINTRIRVE